MWVNNIRIWVLHGWWYMRFPFCSLLWFNVCNGLLLLSVLWRDGCRALHSCYYFLIGVSVALRGGYGHCYPVSAVFCNLAALLMLLMCVSQLLPLLCRARLQRFQLRRVLHGTVPYLPCTAVTLVVLSGTFSAIGHRWALPDDPLGI